MRGIGAAVVIAAVGCGQAPAPAPVQAADAAAALARSSKGQGGKTGTFADEKMQVNGKERAYRLVVPDGIDGQKPAPLVFAFHGLLDSKDLMPLYSRLDDLAKKENFILVYPNGVNRAWPIIKEIAGDDFAFFDQLYDHIGAKYNVDQRRVYLTGMSNGAYFINLLASQRSEKIAAIAPHSGGVGFVAAMDLKVKNKYAVLAIHGAEDIIVKVSEGRATRDFYQKKGHPIDYLEIPRHNHFWATGHDINAKIWKFFVDHPLK